MTSPTQWTDEIDNRTSFIPKKITYLPTLKETFTNIIQEFFIQYTKEFSRWL